jgi:hypothetical protein
MVWLRGFSAAGYVRATDATPALIAESQVIGRIARLAAARQLGWAYLADRIVSGPARKITTSLLQENSSWQGLSY